MKMLDAALEYCRKGLRIFPAAPRSKKPLKPWGVEKFGPMPAGEKQIREWWAEEPSANIVFTPEPHRIIVIDFDGKGAEEWIESRGVEIPFGCPRVRSGRPDGGWHVWMKLPKGCEALTSYADVFENRKSGSAFAIDVKCAKALVTMPPSLHETGKRYVWETELEDLDSIPEAPKELLDALSKAPKYAAARENAGKAMPTMRGDGKNRTLEDLIRLTNIGSRNESAASLAGILLAAGLNHEQAFLFLVPWQFMADNDPKRRFTENELWSVVKKISNREARKRREAEERIADDRERESFGAVRAFDIDAILESMMSPKPKLVSTGIGELNRALLGGFRPGNLYLLLAYAGVGKSALALQAAIAAARQKIGKVAYVSCEMLASELDVRAFAQELAIDAKRLMEGSQDREASKLLGMSRKQFDELDLNYLTTVKSADDLDRYIASLDEAPALVVVDYLQQMRGDVSIKDSRERLEFEAAEYKRLTLKWHVPILLLSSISRVNGAKPDAKPTLRQVRGSEQIVHVVDVGMVLHREKGCNQAEIDIEKGRSIGERVVSLRFASRYVRFAESIAGLESRAEEREIVSLDGDDGEDFGQ